MDNTLREKYLNIKKIYKDEIKRLSSESKRLKHILRNDKNIDIDKSKVDRKYSIVRMQLVYLYYTYSMLIGKTPGSVSLFSKSINNDTLLNVNNSKLIKYIKHMRKLEIDIIYSTEEAPNGIANFEKILETTECPVCKSVNTLKIVYTTFFISKEFRPVVECKHCSTVLFDR